MLCSCMLLIALVFLPPQTAHSSTEDVEHLRRQKQQKIEQQIEKSRIKIQRLHSGLERQKKGYEQTQVQAKGILGDIEELDLRLLKMAQRLQRFKEQMAEQKTLISKKEANLKNFQKKTAKVRAHMEKRIAAYYKLGKIDLLDITFSTKTLPQLLRFHDSFETLVEYDKVLMEKYHRIVDELQGAQQALTLEQELLEELINQADHKRKAIQEARRDKEKLLATIKNQAKLHQTAIKELNESKTRLTSTLLSLKQEEKVVDQGFLLNKGSHVTPLKGVVLRTFNEERVNQFGFKKQSPGIIIDAPDGTKIRSIFDGRVMYAGYLKGYGNTVIVHHGYQYFTITSRMERIRVEKGDIVKRNTVIGIMGSTATITDKGLYFEIRHKDTPLDPMIWLDHDNFT
ncbi:MAG: murein hydrolase activator EnvC [Desulfopila sp.]